MTKVAKELKAKLSKLPTKDRAELAYYLIASLDDGADEDAEAAWDVELAKRESEIKSGKAVGEPAEKVFKRLRRKYS